MTGPVTGPPGSDPLRILREYRTLAPWSLRDLAAVAGSILDASGIFPLNASARAKPSERTIRFYVAQGLVSPPEGRGTAATYSYRHLLQVLAIKLRQMEGATLESITRELADQGGDVIERRVATALGPGLPLPSRLTISQPGSPRGKVGRAIQDRRFAEGAAASPSTCRRIPLGPGVELLVDEHHPVLRAHPDDRAILEAFRETLHGLLPADPSPDSRT